MTSFFLRISFQSHDDSTAGPEAWLSHALGSTLFAKRIFLAKRKQRDLLSLEEDATPKCFRQLYDSVAQIHPDLANSFAPKQEDEVSLRLRGVALVSVGPVLDGFLSRGWPNEAFEVNSKLYGGALDAYLLNVHQFFCIPPWENLPQVTSAEVPRRDSTKKNRLRWSRIPVQAHQKVTKSQCFRRYHLGELGV